MKHSRKLRRLATVAVIGGLFLPWAWPGAFGQQAGPPAGDEAAKHPGEITGAVANAATGQPVAGAYVGIGDFGDAGGANLERFEKQGLYAHTETDGQGRFRLTGIAVAGHPLVVIHPDFVRHDERVALRPETTTTAIRISLTPAAKIHAVVEREADAPARGMLTIRLESLSGHRFIPPGRNPHLSSFASASWSERVKANEFLFTGLPEGDYALDVLTVAPGKATYHGGIGRVRMKAGETKNVPIKPEDHHNTLTVNVPKSAAARLQMPNLVVVNRNAGLLAWDDGLMHHPEDQRLGRIVLNALLLLPVEGGSVCAIGNLPPGTYALFAGSVVSLKGTKVEVVDGKDQELKIEPAQATKRAVVRLDTLEQRIQLDKGAYPAGELCKLLTEELAPRPEIKVPSDQADEVIHVGPGEMTAWDIIERMYVEKGWTATEQGENTLVLGPASPADRSSPPSQRR